MIDAKLDFRGDEALRQIRGACWEGILRATVAFWTELQKVLGVANPWPYKTPASEGEPPRKRTGNLAASVVYELDEANLTTRVGLLPQGRYGEFLDAGKHPWFWVTLDRMKSQLSSLIRGGK